MLHPTIMPKTFIELGILVLLALASFFVIISFTNAPAVELASGITASTVNDQPVFSTAFWGTKIKTMGMQEAYTFLAETIKGMDDYGQHLNAHQFGDALFKIKHADGVVACDNRFGHGCFHQFFITALNKEGAGIATKLTKVCADKLGPGPQNHACNHGIGHGIMAAFNWEDIKGALEVCKSFQNKNAFFACIDGVFMEYFTPTALVAKGKTESIRDVDRKSPDSACISLEPLFQANCYSMAVSWWMTAGVSARDAGKWCGDVKGEKNYEACFKGLGYALVLASRYNKNVVIKKCEEATAAAEEKVFCRAGAHWGFSKGEEVGEVLTEEDKALCDFEEKKWCLKESSLTDSGLGISAICCPDLKSL